MEEAIKLLREFNIYTIILRLILALLLGGLVGLERERNRQAAGLRTHILVCISATMSMLIGLYAKETINLNTDPLRIGAQVISGIGFIGAGAIMVRSGRYIKGITTASGLWCTAAIGLALGIGFYEGAIICVVIVLLVMTALKRLDKTLLIKDSETFIYFEISGSTNVNGVLESIKAVPLDLTVTELSPPKSGTGGNVGITVRLNNPVNDIRKVSQAICAVENVAFAIPERNATDTV